MLMTSLCPAPLGLSLKLMTPLALAASVVLAGALLFPAYIFFKTTPSVPPAITNRRRATTRTISLTFVRLKGVCEAEGRIASPCCLSDWLPLLDALDGTGANPSPTSFGVPKVERGESYL